MNFITLSIIICEHHDTCCVVRNWKLLHHNRLDLCLTIIQNFCFELFQNDLLKPKNIEKELHSSSAIILLGLIYINI